MVVVVSVWLLAENEWKKGFFSRPYGRSFFYIYLLVMGTFVFFGLSLLIYGYVLIVLFLKLFFRSRLVLLIDCPSFPPVCTYVLEMAI